MISSFQQASKQRLGSQPKYTHTHTLSVSLSLSASPITLQLPGDTRSSNWVPAPKLFRCSSSSSSATRSSPNFFSFYSIRSSTRHLLASAQASSSILGFFFLSFVCFLAATSADLLEELRNPARAAAGATAAATAEERERERDEAPPRAPGLAQEGRSSSTGARAGPVLVRGCPGQVGRSDGRGVWDPVPGNRNHQQRVSGTNPPAQ